MEYLVEAGIESLRDLDLSNNKIQYIDDLAPLAQLNLVSLDLYECPVTREVKEFRRVNSPYAMSTKGQEGLRKDASEQRSLVTETKTMNCTSVRTTQYVATQEQRASLLISRST